MECQGNHEDDKQMMCIPEHLKEASPSMTSIYNQYMCVCVDGSPDEFK